MTTSTLQNNLTVPQPKSSRYHLLDSFREINIGTLNLTPKQKQLVNEVLDTNRLSYGKFTKKFEHDFSKAHGCEFGIFCNSGTSALQIALATLKIHGSWSDGDEVLVPAISFVATSNIVLHNGMKPVFIDTDPRTYNIDPTKIEEKITKKTRAIIPVHLFGLVCEMQPIMEIAKKYNLRVIEDSCECVYAKYKDKLAGSFGDISCFSTYVAHFLVTGVGGFALTNNSTYADTLRSLMNHGRDPIYTCIDDDKGLSSENLAEVVSKRFKFIWPGHSFRCTEMEAAIGVGQMENIESIIESRKENALFLTEKLSKFGDHFQFPFQPENQNYSLMFYPIVIKSKKFDKVDLLNHLEMHGIETRDLFPLVNQPVNQTLFGDISKDYPVAMATSKNGFFVGCHQDLTQDDLEYVVQVFDDFLKEL